MLDTQQNENEAACGGSALTAVLGDLADQFECHALSRSIDDVEAAGQAMRAARAEIERYQAGLGDLARYAEHLRMQRDELLAALGSMLFDLGNFDTDEDRIAEFRRLRRQARKLVPNA